MYVSTEILAIVTSAVGVVVTLGVSMFGGFAWVLRRIDDRVDGLEEKLSTRIDTLDERLSTRIDAVEEKLSTRIDAVEEKLSTRIDALAGEVTGVKIAIARLEGPPRHLVTTTR